jgi:hypothetical protein
VEYKRAQALASDVVSLSQFWTERCNEWVRLLTESFGEKYQKHESPHFWIICSQDAQMARRVLNWAEKAYAHLTTVLADAVPRKYGRIPIIMFADLDAYYSYVSEYCQDGEHPASGGVYLFKGYGHLAFCFHELSLAERVIAHELAHAVLLGLKIPLWLNEGVAQTAEISLLGQSAHDFDKINDTFRSFWTERTIQEFWRGTSFHRLDHGRMQSYYLALLLTSKLTRDMIRFRKFVKTASEKDGGQAALYETYGLRLEDLVGLHLGSPPSGGAQGLWKVDRILRY